MGPPTNRSASDQAYAEGEITDTERGIFGSVSMAEILSFFSEYARKLGTAPWAERARTELRASGETARKRDPSTLDQLTPQEMRIALFASGGDNNPDIAAKLFLSRRTVEYHLHQVFTKLGVTSTAELTTVDLHVQ